MTVLLWTIQGALAFLYLAGGAYKVFTSASLSATMPALPAAGWQALGLVEMVGAVLLILPAATRWPALTPVAALVLALETLAIAGFYSTYSWAIEASNPLVWAVAMTLLAAVVAWGRWPARAQA